MARDPYRYGQLGEDAEAFARILALSFGTTPGGCLTWLQTAGHEHVRVLRRGDEVVAGLLLVPMGQYFGGRSVPCTGVAGVGVAPEHRGGGAATVLMAHAVRELARAGVALSALYPALEPLYRRVGYGIAGGHHRTAIALSAIELRRPPGRVRPFEARDDASVRAVYATHAAARDGHLDRGPYVWARTRREEEGRAAHGFVVEHRGRVTGYLFYRQERTDVAHYDLRASDLAFATAEAGRELLAFAGRHATLGRELVFRGSGAEPLVSLLAEPRARVKLYHPWMLRLTDVAAALGARGYPRAVEATLDLAVRDSTVRRNSGRFSLRVAGGVGEARPGGRGSLRVDVDALAALYSGWATPRALALAGRLDGTPRALETAAVLFAGPAPSMADFF